MYLIKNAETYAPAPAGRCDILVGGGQVLRIEPGIEVPGRYCEVTDATGLVAAPGLVDGHVHITGGGGEGGYATRTPELVLSDAIAGGITTVVGCLGTDGVTRSLASLLAKARGLDEEGITAFIYTGHYGIPIRTLTESIEHDLLYIDKIIGVGEVAVSDHRSTQPTFEEFARLVSQARRGGILSGKAGLVNVHMGDGRRGLALLKRVLDETEIPASQLLPTHVNRNPVLFEEAVGYARNGGFVDLTTSTDPVSLEEGEVKCSKGLRAMLDAGVDAGHVTFSSDGQGSLPIFDAQGRLRGLDVGRVTSLIAEVRDAVFRDGVALETALQVVTSNPGRLLKLRGKGQLTVGRDADLILLDPAGLEIRSVMARGRWLMQDGRPLVKGTFESE